jgi:hypothetical protein
VEGRRYPPYIMRIAEQWWTEGKYMDKCGKLAGEVVENLGHILVGLLVLLGSRKE